MIIIAGQMTLDPAKVDDAIDAMRIVEEATLQEEGCLAYGFWPSHTTPGTFRIVEEWETEAAVDAHMSTEHLVEFLGKTAGFGVSGIELTRYDVSATTKFM